MPCPRLGLCPSGLRQPTCRTSAMVVAINCAVMGIPCRAASSTIARICGGVSCTATCRQSTWCASSSRATTRASSAVATVRLLQGPQEELEPSITGSRGSSAAAADQASGSSGGMASLPMMAKPPTRSRFSTFPLKDMRLVLHGSVKATTASPFWVPILPWPPAAITTNCLPFSPS